MVENNAIDTTLYNAYWSKLQQFKFDLIYYDVQFKACVKACRFIKYGIIGITTLATGAWVTWGDLSAIKVVCAIIIWLLQGISAISEVFPFNKRKLELRELSTELEPIYIQMESDWRKIQCMQITNDEISGLMESYAQKQAEIIKHYFKNDALPLKEKYHVEADNLTEEYFKYFV